uniref:Uncharacterized protein n=1 Tax=Cannabis sativa TaxID=3483 RepID=A0A803NV48_CANSA
MWCQVNVWSVTRHWLFGPVSDLMATLFEELTRENFELFVTIGGLEEFTASGRTGSSSTGGAGMLKIVCWVGLIAGEDLSLCTDALVVPSRGYIGVTGGSPRCGWGGLGVLGDWVGGRFLIEENAHRGNNRSHRCEA